MSVYLGRATTIDDESLAMFRVLVDTIVAGNHIAVQSNAALERLVEADWVARDANGRVAAVYPFALQPTGITVRLDRRTYPVMCAIDALGVGPMLGTKVVISASCVTCAAFISVSVDAERIRRRRPASTVVLRRRTAGAAMASRCSATRFACSPAHADAWLAEHGEKDDVMQSLEAAFIEARAIFGECYRPGRSGAAEPGGGNRRV